MGGRDKPGHDGRNEEAFVFFVVERAALRAVTAAGRKSPPDKMSRISG
jgi:hypothetical protein